MKALVDTGVSTQAANWYQVLVWRVGEPERLAGGSCPHRSLRMPLRVPPPPGRLSMNFGEPSETTKPLFTGLSGVFGGLVRTVANQLLAERVGFEPTVR